MRKIVKNTIVTLLILTLGIFIAFLVYSRFTVSDDEDISGEWAAEVDVTQQAAVRAYSWLRDIEGISVSLEDVESCMQNLTVQVNLILEKNARSKGIFQCCVVMESYDACNQSAYEAFAMIFRGILADRLHMAGYTGGTDEEEIEALVTETFGMSTVSYLMSCGPALLPSLEDMQAEYDGSGTYAVAEDVLTRQFDAGQLVVMQTERYIRKGANLILLEETGSGAPDSVIYTLKQSQ